MLSPPRQPPFDFAHCASSFQALSGQKAGKLRVVGLVLLPQSLLSMCGLVPIHLPRTGLRMRCFCKVWNYTGMAFTQGLQDSEAKDMTLERKIQSGLRVLKPRAEPTTQGAPDTACKYPFSSSGKNILLGNQSTLVKRRLLPSGCPALHSTFPCHLLRAESLSVSLEEFCCFAQLGWGWSLLGDKIRHGFVCRLSRCGVCICPGRTCQGDATVSTPS